MRSGLLEITRQLALAARLGLPLSEALRRQPELGSRLDRGDSLGQAMARDPRAFPAFYANMVGTAEASQKPEVILAELSRWLEARDQLERDLRTALGYPVAVANALGLLAVALAWLAPLSLSALGANWSPPAWAAMGVVAGAALLLFDGLLLAGQGHRLTGWIPGLARLRRLAAQSLWARALASLLDAGLDLPRALVLASPAAPGLPVQHLDEQVAQGDSLERALQGRDIDEVLLWSVRTGQNRENLASLLLFAADRLEEEARFSARSLVKQVGPWSMAALGVILVLLVLLFWVPYYQLTALQT